MPKLTDQQTALILAHAMKRGDSPGHVLALKLAGDAVVCCGCREITPLIHMNHGGRGRYCKRCHNARRRSSSK